MRKINDWENIKENSDFKRLEPGAYICAIKAVEDVSDKEYLKIYFDIVKGDNKGYFQKLYDSDTRKDKKWPIAGTLIRSYKESALSMFKGFITAIEKSNKNYKWTFDEKSLVKKYIGLIIADEEYCIEIFETKSAVGSHHSCIEVENEKNSRILAVMDNINDKCFKICSKCLSRYLDMSNEELNKFDI